MWLSNEKPPMPMVKVSKKIIWEVCALIINQRCLVQKVEALEGLQQRPPQTHHNKSLKERFPNGNYKVCSLDKPLVLLNLQRIVEEWVVELRLILTHLWKQVRPWMTVYSASTVDASSQNRQLKDIFRTVRLNTRLSSWRMAHLGQAAQRKNELHRTVCEDDLNSKYRLKCTILTHVYIPKTN